MPNPGRSARYFEEVALSDAAISEMASLDTGGSAHRRPLRDTLLKMIDGYAIHAGQAHMLRFARVQALRDTAAT